jgi:hypothetical protein
MKDQMHRTCSTHEKHKKLYSVSRLQDKRKRLLKGMWHRCLENIKLDFKAIGYMEVDLVLLASNIRCNIHKVISTAVLLLNNCLQFIEYSSVFCIYKTY